MVPRILSEDALAGAVTMMTIEDQPNECAPYDIRAVPTMLVINNHGREISRKIGFMDIDRIMTWLLDLGAV